MSSTNPTSPLTPKQLAHKNFFQAPEGSLCQWAVNKIADYELNENVVYPIFTALVVKRIMAVCMPVFAFIDAVKSMGKAIKAIQAKPSDKFFHLLTSAKM